MGKSIFEFSDKFGFESPWDNWIESDFKQVPGEVATISELVIVNQSDNVFFEDIIAANLKKGIVLVPITIVIKTLGAVDKVEVGYGNSHKQIAKRKIGTPDFEVYYNLEIPQSISRIDKYSVKEIKFTATVTDANQKKVTDTETLIVKVDTKSTIIEVNNKKASIKENKINDKKYNLEVCPIDPKYRSHFVLHCTAGNLSLQSIKDLTKYDTNDKMRSKAHVYIMVDGSTLQIWPFSEKNVWATKSESINNLKGQMFHVEINYGSPAVPSKEQYEALANLYIDASSVEKCWPIIVPHIEVDRGIADGHSDPTDFDYNYFYKLLKTKEVPIDKIPKFDHDRYWGDKSYKVPWASDKKNWPPLLKGNPHK